MKFSNNQSGFNPSIFFILLVLLFAGSCKTAKKIQASVEKKDTTSVHISNPYEDDSLLLIKNTVADINKKQIDFKTFLQRLK